MDVTSVPGELSGPLATIAAIFALWKLAGENIATWRSAKQVGKVPATPYDVLASRVATLEAERKEEAEERRRDAERLTAIEEELIRLRASVRRLAGVLTREVSQVLAWIAGGSRPPAPDREITLIRSVIADLERDTPDAQEAP